MTDTESEYAASRRCLEIGHTDGSCYDSDHDSTDNEEDTQLPYGTSSQTGHESTVADGHCKRSSGFTFIASITVPRSGRDISDFSSVWSEKETRERLSRLNRGHTFVEFLAPERNNPAKADWGKFYLDRDVYVGVDPPTAEVLASNLREVIDYVQELVDHLAGFNQERATGVHFKIATRHGWCYNKGEHKLSYRPFIQGIRIRRTDIPKVLKIFIGHPEFWDMSVYKSGEQLLAAINGCKGMIGGVDDKRVLTPESPDDDVLMYVAQHYNPEWMPVTAGPKYEQRAKDKARVKHMVSGCGLIFA